MYFRFGRRSQSCIYLSHGVISKLSKGQYKERSQVSSKIHGIMSIPRWKYIQALGSPEPGTENSRSYACSTVASGWWLQQGFGSLRACVCVCVCFCVCDWKRERLVTHLQTCSSSPELSVLMTQVRVISALKMGVLRDKLLMMALPPASDSVFSNGITARPSS